LGRRDFRSIPNANNVFTHNPKFELVTRFRRSYNDDVVNSRRNDIVQIRFRTRFGVETRPVLIGFRRQKPNQSRFKFVHDECSLARRRRTAEPINVPRRDADGDRFESYLSLKRSNRNIVVSHSVGNSMGRV